MSVQAMSWVIEHSKHTENTFIVLLMIANHAKSDGTLAWPSMAVIAKESRCSLRCAQYAVKNLVESGELQITKEAGPRTPRIYALPGVQKLHEVGRNNCTSGVQPLHLRGASNDIEGCNQRHANKEEPSLKQPSINRPKHFVQPSLEEVARYCQERTNQVDPEKWFDYYTSNGFKVGRSGMKDWKASVRLWEKNQNGGNRDDHKTAERRRRDQRQAEIFRKAESAQNMPKSLFQDAD